ncbi:MoaD/ThiS family protein [Brevundimonas sp. Marseille-Q4549]
MARVTLFGAFQDLAGWREVETPAATLEALIQALEADNPRLEGRLAHPSTLVIVDEALVPAGRRNGAQPLAADAAVAFGPPVSGG